MQTNIFLVHDGVNNSVFFSQVLNPLKKQARKNPNEQFYIFSFSKNKGRLIFGMPKNLKIVFVEKSFFQTINTQRFKKFLKTKPNSFVIARNAVAGYIAQQAGCQNLLVQARGILTEEYGLANPRTSNPIKNLLSWLRQNYYLKIERSVYGNYANKVEAVSSAMREFLNKKYGTLLENITIAKLDIPKPIDLEQRNEWRAAMRKSLDIDQDAKVICYSGSVQAWQQPKDIVPFLKEKQNEMPNSKLLILTPGIDAFKKVLNAEGADPESYKIVSVQPNKMFEYLSAADYGVIYRKEHIVNWVCRPTKALEYKAAGLEIIHNGTVDFLNKEF